MVGPQIIPWYHLINIECNATDLPLDALVEECSKVRRLVAQRKEECEWAYEGHSHFPNSQTLRHKPKRGAYIMDADDTYIIGCSHTAAHTIMKKLCIKINSGEITSKAAAKTEIQLMKHRLIYAGIDVD